MPRLSRDQDDPDNDNMDGAALAQAVARTLIDMDPREGEIFAEAMQELLNSGDPLQWAEGILDNTANGATDRHRRARDTRRRPANDSAAADKSFARRFPGAARIDVSGGGLQEREREAEQRRKAAQRGGPSPLFNRLTSRVS